MMDSLFLFSLRETEIPDIFRHKLIPKLLTAEHNVISDPIMNPLIALVIVFLHVRFFSRLFYDWLSCFSNMATNNELIIWYPLICISDGVYCCLVVCNLKQILLFPCFFLQNLLSVLVQKCI